MNMSRALAVLMIPWVCVVWITRVSRGEEGLKVVCAARAHKPPAIDGLLDDACWRNAEVRTDFTAPGDGRVLKRPTTMRVLHDHNHLYFGFEVFWDDAEALRKGIAGIRKKYPQISEGVWLKEWKYANTYGLEVFLDAGASGRNYYQVLFNAAGQCIGNYKCMFDCFNINPLVKGTVKGSCWRVEMAYPAKGLTAGQEWGLNVCRNDETYYGIWKQVGGNYQNPKLFGRLVVGDYREWWDVAGGESAMAQLGALRAKSARYARLDPCFKPMLDDVTHEMGVMRRLAKRHPPVDRANFERLYEQYSAVRDKLERLRAQGATLEMLKGLRSGGQPQ